MSELMKICDLCKQKTRAKGDDLLYFGEWMTRSDITVHYYCLLLSTNLAQEGTDHGGILGFLLRDIRKFAKIAESIKCMYCDQTSATIMCRTCKGYFHITCGLTSFALSQFVDQFQSYCHKCIPLDDVTKKLQNNPLAGFKQKCYICLESLIKWQPTLWIYAKCCGNGYVHSKCMKQYALKAGYYLNCIWCKDKRFREDVKYLGVFVPDRDASWEREGGAYRDIHHGHQRCDMEKCNCPKGRDFKTAKWSIILCKLCGSFGAHNPHCIPGMEHEKEKILEFKCDTCSAIEQTQCFENLLEDLNATTGLNTTLYVVKGVKPNVCLQLNDIDSSNDSVLPVINKNILQCTISSSSDKSQPTIVENTSTATNVEDATNNKSDRLDPEIGRLLVKRMLDLFE